MSQAQPTAQLLALIRSDDPVEIERGRNLVTPADIDLLIEHYWSTQSWAEKLNIIELTQDQAHPALITASSDFLRAPIAPGDDRGELAKAIALGHFGQEFDHQVDDVFDRFTEYLNDREFLRRKVDEALELLGFELEPLPVASPAPSASQAIEPLTGSPDERLLTAAAVGSTHELERALTDGADPSAVLEAGDYVTCSALIRASMNGHEDLVVILVESGAAIDHRRSGPRPSEPEQGQTALWWAAGQGRLRLVEFLASAGAAIDIPDSWGSTPLHQAAGGGHLEVAEYLLDAGAAAMARISDGRTPINLAATHGQTRLVQLLTERGVPADTTGSAGYTPLMVACEDGNQDMVAVLVDAGASVDARHPGEGIYAGLHGWTPLVFAVRGGRVKVTQQMLVAGADPDAIITPAHGNDSARRVIDFCHGRQSERIRELLVQAGARLSVRN